MGKTTIEWADYTFNPWRGCTKVSPGCKNCYAAEQAKRNPKTLGVWGPEGTRVVASEQAWKDVLAWNRKAARGDCPSCDGKRKNAVHESGYGYEHCEACDGSGEVGPHRRRVFCGSMCDVFEDWQGVCRDSHGKAVAESLDDIRVRLFELIDATPNLDWMLLTKRIENARRMVPTRDDGLDGKRRNVWLGTSVENQEQASLRIPELIGCRDLASVLFLSCEPLLCEVDLHKWLFVGEEGGWEYVGSRRNLIKWVIVGGESGFDARECSPEWIRFIVQQCREGGVPCFVKQLGSNVSGRRISHVKGGDPAEWPEDLRVREFPGSAKKVAGRE